MISAARIAPPYPVAGFRLRLQLRPRAASKICCAAAPPAQSTLYDVLGLRAGATGREIKAAYRRLARERHPDVAGAPATGEFIWLHDAYATLSDPDKRARYDRDIMARGSTAAAAAAARWWWPGRRPRRTWETDQCW